MKQWQDAPAYFFEITPDTYRYGMGFYQASRDTMDKLRDRIDTHPREFGQAVAFYAEQQTFRLEGEEYKKPLKPDVPSQFCDWYQRKTFYLVAGHKVDARLFSSGLTGELAADFLSLASFYHYLRRISDLGKDKEV